MRRWNGWGDDAVVAALNDGAGELLRPILGDVARRLDPDGPMDPGELLPGGVDR